MTRYTSEYVSLGHPDKVCDYISSYILDRYLELDRDTRFALEVQMKDNEVRLGGEITSKAKVTRKQRAEWVREAVASVGYDAKYASVWGNENVPCADSLKVTEVIGEQSPDIAQGVAAEGWGDQGIFWGMAVNNPLTGYMPADFYLAKAIGKRIYEERIGGLDVKTQVTIEDSEHYPKPDVDVVVAVPSFALDYAGVVKDVKAVIRKELRRLRGCLSLRDVVVNGTGSYVRHGSIGDCGTTGRKLVVDFYGGNCRIGGGSPWTKDGSKADLALNIYARQKALQMLKKRKMDAVFCAIDCCIGRRKIGLVYRNIENRIIEVESEDRPASEIVEELGLKTPRFAALCRNGLFT